VNFGFLLYVKHILEYVNTLADYCDKQKRGRLLSAVENTWLLRCQKFEGSTVL